MKAYIYVEGEADKLALEALLSGYREQLKQQRHGISFIVLGNKDAFFVKFGPKAAARLVEGVRDCVVALPDLYPNQPYRGSPSEHADLPALQTILGGLVRHALRDVYCLRAVDVRQCLGRFHASALKHDLEMLLLAAWPRLAEQIGQDLNRRGWRSPVEDQDQDRPPKRIVEAIFRTRTGRAYRDTLHAPAVLRRVRSIEEVLSDSNGRAECPVFGTFLSWLGEKTGVPAR